MSRAPVALDLQGADGGPEVVLEGASIAAEDGIPVRAFGPAGLAPPPGIDLIAAERWIGNDAEPVAAVRSTPDASVVMAAEDAAHGRSASLVSLGSTGAAMTAALFAMKRIRGVHRPALAAQVPVPATGRSVLLLDCGANTEVRPQHLLQFAHLGAAFGETVLGIERPRVALLSVGEEQKKGRPDVVEAHRALSESDGIAFAGNIEGRDLLSGEADVIVTDGFTGNVALKTLEGTARAVAGAVRDAARSGPLAAAGGLLLRPALGKLRAAMDPNEVGGAILLGLRGVAVVGHGSSTPDGVANAIRLADASVRGRAVERTTERLQAFGATRGGARARDSATRPDGQEAASAGPG